MRYDLMTNEKAKKFNKLLNIVISRYSEEIDYDADLSLYDVMIQHFASGDLDDVLESAAFAELSKEEQEALLKLTHKYQGLCFYEGNPEFWLDSLDGRVIADYSLIAYSILDSFDYLLNLARNGGENALKVIESIKGEEVFNGVPAVQYLRNTFVDDRVLTTILADMGEDDSLYNIFTAQQKSILLNYPEGTLYAFENGEVSIIPPLVLGVQIHNETADENFFINEIDYEDLEPLVLSLSEYMRGNAVFDFENEIISLGDRYRDYAKQSYFWDSSSVDKIRYDETGEKIKRAWQTGDAIIGGDLETPFFGNIK